MPDGGDVLRPGLSIVALDRIGIVEKHIHGAPDLVVEILSESTEARDPGIKAERYLRCGVKEYWILDPRDRTLQVWNNRGDSWAKRKAASLESELLPGLFITTRNVFSGH